VIGDAEPLPAEPGVEVRAVDAASEEARHCLSEYFAELDQRMETGYDPEAALPATAAEMTPPEGLFLVAYRQGVPIGCGGLKLHGSGPAEIKRMWVSPGARRLGVGRRLLAALEAKAASLGAPALRLDTNGVLIEAIAMYESNGFRPVPAFNSEPHATHWFEKVIPGRS